MDFLIYLIIGLFILFIFGCKIFLIRQEEKPMSRRSPFNDVPDEAETTLPYRARPSLLTPAEKNFHEALRPLVSEHWHLFSKVRMEDILEVERGLERKEAYGYRSRIKSRHIDFVLCDKESLEVLLCIELDDRSHQRRNRKEVDDFKDRAMSAAGITLTRVPVQASYSENYLRNLLFEESSDPVKANEPDRHQTNVS